MVLLYVDFHLTFSNYRRLSGTDIESLNIKTVFSVEPQSRKKTVGREFSRGKKNGF